jgi:hypothetical protein
MEPTRLDTLARTLSRAGSRRAGLRILLGTLVGGPLLGPSLAALAAPGKEKKTGNGGGGTKPDRHVRDGKITKDRHKHPKKDRDQAHLQDRTDGQVPDSTDEQAPDPTDEAVVESGAGGGDAVRVAAATCRQPGARCTKGSQCCTGKCIRKRKCSCDASNPCQAGRTCRDGKCVSLRWTNQTTFGSWGMGASQFRNLSDVAVTEDGLTALVADVTNQRISVWTRNSSTSTDWTNQTTFGSEGSGPSQFHAPYGVAVAADGLMAWVADAANDRISVWIRS